LSKPAVFNASGRYCTPVGRNPRIEGASMIAYRGIWVIPSASISTLNL
jgi:hypothetical protein